ncbi:hypothetical protein IWW39_002127 [Coemansia spiralis]|uniref:Protein kinase domain-containing protein n=1 Tax=Coemansia spiralis TaxID=417178 RepID=A0A9W8GNT7_9FUNG|nr:hypothetical protein IWW39_002127 [Coemansia spiralis]
MCQILHRDLSDNNILIVRKKGTVRGLLIGFDCAIDISEGMEDGCGEMTGTLPFMSLNNLTYSNIKRTNLDDWESLLYLLCWYATIGLGTEEEPTSANCLNTANPFEMRSPKWEDISKDLLGVLVGMKNEVIDWEDTHN